MWTEKKDGLIENFHEPLKTEITTAVPVEQVELVEFTFFFQIVLHDTNLVSTDEDT